MPDPTIPSDEALLEARFGTSGAPPVPEGGEDLFGDEDLATMRADAAALAEAISLRGALGLANQDHLAAIDDPAEPEPAAEVTDFPVDAAFVESANAAQLHDEARGSYAPEDWPASLTSPDEGETWVYRVQRDDLSRSEKAKVTKAIAAHKPKPTDADRLEELATKAAGAPLVGDELSEAVGLLLAGRRRQ